MSLGRRGHGKSVEVVLFDRVFCENAGLRPATLSHRHGLYWMGDVFAKTLTFLFVPPFIFQLLVFIFFLYGRSMERGGPKMAKMSHGAKPHVFKTHRVLFRSGKKSVGTHNRWTLCVSSCWPLRWAWSRRPSWFSWRSPKLDRNHTSCRRESRQFGGWFAYGVVR